MKDKFDKDVKKVLDIADKEYPNWGQATRGVKMKTNNMLTTCILHVNRLHIT